MKLIKFKRGSQVWEHWLHCWDGGLKQIKKIYSQQYNFYDMTKSSNVVLTWLPHVSCALSPFFSGKLFELISIKWVLSMIITLSSAIVQE